jgi:AcrR family transcriptional regulator
MTKEELSTKEKILSTAHRLFAEKGVNGVGVREIAKIADVNVAAINYHFGNKESLHNATIGACMVKMNTEIAGLYDAEMTITELVSAHYDHLLKNKDDLITSFKLFLDHNNAPLEMHADDKMIGPPGGAVVMKCLSKYYPETLEADLMWAVRTILTQTIHTALIICNHSDTICENTGMTELDMKNSLLRTVRVVVSSLSV